MTRLHYGNEHSEGIQADHSGIVKYPNADDQAYESVKYKLISMRDYGLNRRAASRGT